MRITNIRVLNNYKVKLINAKFSGVSPFESAFNDQGTRPPSDFPTIITTPPDPEFQEKFNRVFNYLINRYEPGWSAATADLGRAATMQLLGISASINPLILGGTVESSFNYTTNGNDGWFDILTHPKDFASSVRTAYKKFERARSPQKASNKFIQYNLNGIYAQDFLFDGGNAFFGFHPKFDWYPGNSLPYQIHMGLSANYDNCIRRSVIHSPYGNFSSPMNSIAGNWRRYPWLSDRYTAESFQFDMYLLLRENTTVRDLLNLDVFGGRSAEFGVVVGGVIDAHLNTSYKGTCFAAGLVSRVPFNDYGRTGGGYSADQVLIGSPWIRYPEALTYSSWWGVNSTERAGLCFAYETLTLFNGMTFPNSPQDLRELIFKPPMTDVVGISYGYGNRLLQSLNNLSAAWGNSMEFIAYLGCLPYGTGFEMRIPFGLYRDPTVAGNKEYFKWRLDASVSHWKEKFKSPNDGFAHVIMDASAVIERTFHQWQAPGYTLWTNIASSGASYVENIPVEWARDQYNYTFGDSGPNTTGGVVLGVERFAQYMFKDDVGLNDPTRNDQRRFAGDANPRHWCLDDDKANDLFTSGHDMFLGQRKWGLTYSNSIWGMGICGTSELGEIMAVCTPEDSTDTNKSVMSAYPFFYNVFTEVQNNGDIKWKRVPDTLFNGTIDGVPWINDRRFRLFYLYPTMLALNMSIVDYFHDGVGYYNHLNKSGWYDKSLGIRFRPNMETNGNAPVVSNFPFPNRKTTTKPPQNFWTGYARTSEFELLYACMKGGITTGLDSLYFNELHEELLSGLIDPPDTSRTGFFRALDFAVFGSSYKQFPDIENNPSVVPMLRPTSQRIYFRGNPWLLSGVCGAGLAVNNTGGMPLDQFNEIINIAEQIPVERRVLIPTYWLLDGPPNGRMGDFFWKQTSDGTSYGTDIPGKTYPDPTYPYADTNPLRFNTIWAYENRANAKESFQNFLKQAKNRGIYFSQLQDDSESGGPFGFGSFYNDEKNLANITADIDNFASGGFNYLEVPDARRAKALVLDPRFRGVTNSINGRSFAEEFEYIYNQIRQAHGEGICGASAETILNSHLTNVNNRFDFKQLYGGTRDRQYQWYAWNSAIYTFWHGDLKTKIIGGALDAEVGYGDVLRGSADVYATNAAEARFAVDANGHHRVQEYIPGYGHVFHSYAQLSGGKYSNGLGGGGVIDNFGYPPGVTTDEATRYGKSYGWHPVSEGGITFGCSAYQAFVNDIRRVRGILRTRPQAYVDGMYTWICASLTGNDGGYSGAAITTQFYQGNCYAAEYYKEHIFHLCLNGIRRFNPFHVMEGEPNNPTLLNECLVEWKNMSGNTIGSPCTNATATVGATVDRIDLYQAGTNFVISGAMTTDPNKRLWRITVPHTKTTLTKTSTTQPTLPSTISIPIGSRGVWVEAPASYGKPEYQSS